MNAQSPRVRSRLNLKNRHFSPAVIDRKHVPAVYFLTPPNFKLLPAVSAACRFGHIVDSTEKQSRMWEIVALPRNLSLYSGMSSNRIPNAKAQMSCCLQQEHVSSFHWNSLRTIFNLWTRRCAFFHPNDLTEVLWEFTFAAIPWKCFHIFSSRGYTTLLGCHHCDSFTRDISA